MSNEIAYVLCGGSVSMQGPCPAGNKPMMWGYTSWAIQAGPALKANGVKRLFLHNPAGLFYLGYHPNSENDTEEARLRGWPKHWSGMWCSQFLLARQTGIATGDFKDLRRAHELLTEHFGVEEIIYYVGSPDQIGRSMATFEQCIAPVLDCGVNASLGLDSVFRRQADVLDVIDRERGKGRKVYTEPRVYFDGKSPFGDTSWLAGHVDGTIAHLEFDARYKPELKRQPGETLVIANHGTKLPAGCTLVARLHENNLIPGVPNNWTPEDWHVSGNRK